MITSKLVSLALAAAVCSCVARGRTVVVSQPPPREEKRHDEHDKHHGDHDDHHDGHEHKDHDHDQH
jgi:hypothetical protein